MRRATGQGKQLVVRRAAHLAHQPRTALRQLPVQRQTAQVRAAYGELHLVRRKWRGVQHGAGQTVRRMRHSPHGRHRASMQASGECEQRKVLAGRRNQRHAPRHAGHSLRHEAGRHGYARQIEQVRKIGVVTQVRIKPDRVGFYRFDGVDGAGRGRDQAINAVPDRPGLAFEFLEPVHCGKGVGR